MRPVATGGLSRQPSPTVLVGKACPKPLPWRSGSTQKRSISQHSPLGPLKWCLASSQLTSNTATASSLRIDLSQMHWGQRTWSHHREPLCLLGAKLRYLRCTIPKSRHSTHSHDSHGRSGIIHTDKVSSTYHQPACFAIPSPMTRPNLLGIRGSVGA
jgi:hypothetical protein